MLTNQPNWVLNGIKFDGEPIRDEPFQMPPPDGDGGGGERSDYSPALSTGCRDEPTESPPLIAVAGYCDADW